MRVTLLQCFNFSFGPPGGMDCVRRNQGRDATRGYIMNLPKIDISALPDLDTVTGIFGSLAHTAQVQSSDDTIIIMMVFVYDIITGH